MAITDPTTDERFSLFSDDDRTFLKTVFDAHPAIERNFIKYLNTPAGFSKLAQSISDMKETKRSGWIKRGVPRPESIAAHSGGLHYLTLITTTPEGVDMGRVARMITYHDLPEVIITDFTPSDNVDEHFKSRLEMLAMQVIVETLPNAVAAVGCIQEYNDQKTPESHWLNDLDKLEAVTKALMYEGMYPQKIGMFREFMDYAKPRLKTQEGNDFASYLEEHTDDLRKQFKAMSDKVRL